MPTVSAAFEHRDYQQRIITKAIKLLDNDGHSVLIESPVGSGKTGMGLHIGQHYAEQGMSVGWCAMRRNLLKQAQGDKDKFDLDYPLTTISMFQTVAPHVDVLFVDEAHHDATASMNTIHGMIKPKLIIGLSATPKRSDKVGLAFKHRIKDAGIGELIRLGYLSQYRHFTIPDWNPLTVAAAFMREPQRWGKSLVFFRTFEECTLFANLLRQAGFKAVDIVTADTDRDDQIERLQSGELQVLVNMMVLTEGFNCPDLQSVFIRPSSALPTIQMGGRVLRKFAGIDFKNMVQCRETKHPFAKTAEPERSFKWADGAWIPVGVSPDLEDRIAANRVAIVAASQNLTPSVASLYLAKKRGQARPGFLPGGVRRI